MQKNTNEKNYVAILIPDKVDFKKEIFPGRKEGIS